MQTIRAYISAQQAIFTRHAFFDALADAPSLLHVMRVAPRLAFWVMAFQDILRLNEQLVSEPALRKIARHHKAEDAGHERWFLTDIAQFGGGELDVKTLFGPGHRATRDAAYALVSEVFRAESDLQRIVLVLTLESTGHIFFERMARFVDAHGGRERLRYFSAFHLEIEQAHEVFEERMLSVLDARTLTPDEVTAARALVDRCYAAFTAMFDGLFTELVTARLAPRTEPQLAAGA